MNSADRADGRDSGSEAFWTRCFLGMALGMLAVRAVYAAMFPLDLAPDESYYWDWGRRPALGYFSKPPMIGWLMALAGALGNDSMFILKFFPAVLATAGLGFVFLLGRDLYGARAGFGSALFLAATPANVALNVFFTIDAPLFLFWSASLWIAWRWWQAGEDGRGGVWLAGWVVSLGLGYLTKQIHLVFPVLFMGFVVLVAGRGGRRRWRGPALAMAVSLLFLIPPLVWNAQHGWITFRHTADELEGTSFRWGRSLKFVGEFLGGQAALGGVGAWLLMMWATVEVVRHWRGTGLRERFLVLFFAPGFLAFLALSVHQRVEQNWPMVFYTSAAVLAAGRWLGDGRRPGWPPKWAVGIGAVLAVGVMAVPFVVPRLAWAGAKSDPTARIRGWKELAQRIEPRRRAVPRPDRTLLMTPTDRYVASALAYYLPDRPRTYCWEVPGRPESQYGIWGRPVDREGWDALVIEEGVESELFRDLSTHFERWTPQEGLTIDLGPGGARTRKYRVYLGEGFRPSREKEAR